jgi:hypothetical protein
MTLKKRYCKLKEGVRDGFVCRIRFRRATEPSQDNAPRMEMGLLLRFMKHENMKRFYSENKTGKLKGVRLTFTVV